MYGERNRKLMEIVLLSSIHIGRTVTYLYIYRSASECDQLPCMQMVTGINAPIPCN